MIRRNIFGRHLYSQIVVPLMVASVLVGVVATVIAVYFLSDLTNRWVDQVAQSTTSNLAARFDARAESMMRVSNLAAQDSKLKEALAEGDLAKVRGIIVQSNVALAFDEMFLMDSEGVVVAATGFQDIVPGDRLMLDEERTWAELAMAHPMFLDLGGEQTLTALQPVIIGTENTVYTLGVSRVIDDAFLQEIAGGGGDAFFFYSCSPDGGVRGRSPIEAHTVTEGHEALGARLTIGDPAVAEAIRIAEESSRQQGASSLTVDGENYRVWAQNMQLADSPENLCETYLVAAVSQQISDEAGETTRNLIIMWSIIAVVALVGLGGWVARRVSDPLVELATGAQRIAEGDFSTKMVVGGNNEIAELAESFNQMTDSLRDRSESLTKKVLELATLYEMSRALGSTFEMDVLLDSVLDSALRIFGVELGYVMLRHKDTGQLDVLAWRGAEPGVRNAVTVRSSMSEWVVREGRPLIYNPVREGDAWAEVDPVTGAQAALCVPLMSGDGPIGSITVGSRDAGFKFNSEDVRLLSTIANHMTIAVGNIELFLSLQEAYLATVRSLAAAVDAKDPYTRGHSDRVAQYATMTAEHMGLSHDQRIALEMAAYLHDIGKIGINEEILLKPGRLTDEEMGQMRHHPLIGANILRPVAFPWPITPVVRHHHEKYDGTGYPAGLQGEEIPLLARILTVADSFEAMVSDRPYRAGRTEEEAVAELERCAGAHFDARIVDAFVAALRGRAEQVDDVGTPTTEETQPEEIRAIFVALCDGMFASFRRLGGPRLAANVEGEIGEYFRSEGLPFGISHGRMTLGDFSEVSSEEQLEFMRMSLRHIDRVMGRLSGHTLVDHFYADALASLSERMRRIAAELDLYDRD